MPISKKIIDEVVKLDIKGEEKELLIEVLNLEDEGLRNYTKRYEEVVDRFIKNIQKQEGK